MHAAWGLQGCSAPSPALHASTGAAYFPRWSLCRYAYLGSSLSPLSACAVQLTPCVAWVRGCSLAPCPPSGLASWIAVQKRGLAPPVMRPSSSRNPTLLSPAGAACRQLPLPQCRLWPGRPAAVLLVSAAAAHPSGGARQRRRRASTCQSRRSQAACQQPIAATAQCRPHQGARGRVPGRLLHLRLQPHLQMQRSGGTHSPCSSLLLLEQHGWGSGWQRANPAGSRCGLRARRRGSHTSGSGQQVRNWRNGVLAPRRQHPSSSSSSRPCQHRPPGLRVQQLPLWRLRPSCRLQGCSRRPPALEAAAASSGRHLRGLRSAGARPQGLLLQLPLPSQRLPPSLLPQPRTVRRWVAWQHRWRRHCRQPMRLQPTQLQASCSCR